VNAETHCSHNKLYNAACLECELVWHEDQLRAAQERVEHHRHMLEIITSLRDAINQEGP
jgi:hypothetical protein